MKYVPDRTGRFAKRPHYEPEELDRECETIICDFLRKKYAEIRFPVSTSDLTTLLEKAVEDLDTYADLSEFGENVEGVTIFSRTGKPSVRIAAELGEGISRENRLRTTLTHEFGHVHFHGYLWNRGVMELDFGDGSGGPMSAADNRQVCKRETLIDAPVGDWMEWQAGHVCGAILMPASRVRRLIQEKFQAEIGAASITDDSALGGRLIGAIKEAFSVSQDAARVRLLRLQVLRAPSGMASLFQA